jgi:hypothetical protein
LASRLSFFWAEQRLAATTAFPVAEVAIQA